MRRLIAYAALIAVVVGIASVLPVERFLRYLPGITGHGRMYPSDSAAITALEAGAVIAFLVFVSIIGIGSIALGVRRYRRARVG